MRDLTGLDQQVVEHVMATPGARDLVNMVVVAVCWLTTIHRGPIEVGIGCVGGRHRSVALAEAVASCLRLADVPAYVNHRDVQRAVLPASCAAH